MPIALPDDNTDTPSSSFAAVKQVISSHVSSLFHKRIAFHKATTTETQDTKKYVPINKLSLSSSAAKTESAPSSSKEVLDENDFHPPKVSLFPKGKFTPDMMRWKSITRIGSGLQNYGNTCFLNSVIQCLTYCPPLVNYLASKHHSSSCQVAGFCMLCLMEKHVQLALSSSGAIGPRAFAGNIRAIAPGFRPGRQEDAHEFLRFVIESAQKSSLAPFQKDKKMVPVKDAQTTAIGQIFGGYLQSQVKCMECKHDSNTYDPFMDLSVDIGGSVSDLEGALKKFIKPDVLEARNMYMCSKCKKRVKALKRMRIHQAPPVLTIQLKRFSFNHFHGGKINKPISFPQNLTLDSYMTTHSDEPQHKYTLYGVLVHLGGSTNSGHYYCYVKGSNDMWYCMDDTHVTQVTLSAVLSEKAYMLFYIRTSPVVDTPTSVKSTETVVSPTPIRLKSNLNGVPRGPMVIQETTNSEAKLQRKTTANGHNPALPSPGPSSAPSTNGHGHSGTSSTNGHGPSSLSPSSVVLNSVKNRKRLHDEDGSEDESPSSPPSKKRKSDSFAVKASHGGWIVRDILPSTTPSSQSESETSTTSTITKSENGNSTHTNGRSHENGHTTTNGHSHKTNNGSDKVDTTDSNISHNHKHSAANGNDDNVDSNPVNGSSTINSSSNNSANDFLSTMGAVRDPAGLFKRKVGTWDDEETQAKVTNRSSQLKHLSSPSAANEKLFQPRDEYDVEYDMGKVKKVKRNKNDLFADKTNKFQIVANQRRLTNASQ